VPAPEAAPGELPVAVPSQSNAWTDVREKLEQALPGFLAGQRWFGGKTRTIESVAILDLIPVPLPAATASVAIARVDYAEGAAETYALPLLDCTGTGAAPGGGGNSPPTLVIRTAGGEERLFCDAFWDRSFLEQLLETLAAAGRFPGAAGEMIGLPTPTLESLRRAAEGWLEPSLMKAEQSNTSILYGRCFVLKFFRHVEEGLNPDFEIGEFLTRRAGFAHVPPAAGAFEYRRPGAAPATMGILQGFVANQGDAWQQTLGALDAYFDRVERAGGPPPRLGRRSLLADAGDALPLSATGWLGDYPSSARLLGRRIAELHLALASDSQDPDFSPESFSLAYQREVHNAMSRLAQETFGMLRRRAADLPAPLRAKADAVLGAEGTLVSRFRLLDERPLSGQLTRIHGDLHLGQVLWTGEDFVFIDFEGEPARSLAERRAKHSPVRDIAGMIRSFHYAAYAALFRRAGSGGTEAPLFAALAPFANAWYRWVSSEFLRAYLETAAGAAFLPGRPEELGAFLNLWLLDKAVYELKYELNHRLSWVAIPLEGIAGLLEEAG
jgi:trehalose synthase-fused probable maltokinase